MRYLLPMILYLGLTAYVIADIAQSREEEPFRMPKVLWILVVLFAPFVGAGAWILAKWMNRGGGSGGGQPRRAPAAPDDDPEYLKWLAEQERRRRQEGERG